MKLGYIRLLLCKLYTKAYRFNINWTKMFSFLYLSGINSSNCANIYILILYIINLLYEGNSMERDKTTFIQFQEIYFRYLNSEELSEQEAQLKDNMIFFVQRACMEYFMHWPVNVIKDFCKTYFDSI